MIGKIELFKQNFKKGFLTANKKGQLLNMYSGEYREKIAKDLLNKLCFSAASNDLLFRYQHVLINGYQYTKDRGYSFEQQLHDNTDNMLNHSLGYYKPYEAKALKANLEPFNPRFACGPISSEIPIMTYLHSVEL